MLDKYVISPDLTVKNAIARLDESHQNAIAVVNQEGILLGLFANGDMRKYILSNGDLSCNIQKAMNPFPITFGSVDEARDYIKSHRISVCPIIDSEQHLIDMIYDLNDAPKANSAILNKTPLVIMAGGKGTRLYPYTKILPKALIPIGDLTISERIIQQFYKYGCRQVYFILNHKANMIKSYFNDLSPDYKVHYVQEEKFLGTGGGLCLLKGKIHDTFILSNCDILVNSDFECIYKMHKRNKNKITFVCAMKHMTIPYGVIHTDTEGKIIEMTEKPEFSFLTNTGVYIIEPEVIEELEEDIFIHLPDIAQKYINRGDKVGVFPIPERAWLDMGQVNEMEAMMKEFEV